MFGFFFGYRKAFEIEEVKSFHPSGKAEPNGICYQRGQYWKEVRENLDSFAMGKALRPAGMLVCPAGSKLAAAQVAERGFCGQFVSPEGLLFNNESATVSVPDSPDLNALRKCAERIMIANNLPAVLLKEAGTDKVYILRSNRIGYGKD